MTEKSERTPEDLRNEMESLTSGPSLSSSQWSTCYKGNNSSQNSLNIETKYRYLPESRGSRELVNNGVS